MADDNFEESIIVEQLLAKAQRLGVLSQIEADLVRKFHCEGCQPEELRDGAAGPSGIALYYRVQRAVHRLRRMAANGHARNRRSIHVSTNAKNTSSIALELSGEMSIRNSERDFSPELSNVPRLEHDVSQIAA